MDMNKRIVNNTAFVFIALLLCKLAAFLQEMIMAASFGANYLSDAFNTVYGIKQAVFPMFVVGINQVFLPIYKKKLLEKDENRINEFTNYVISVTGAAVLVLVALIYCFTPAVVNIVAPGFSEAAKEITIELVKISVVSYLMICISAIISSMIMAEGHFFISNFASSLQHICVIIAIIFFYNKWGIASLAVALVIGSLLQLIIQAPFIHKGYRYKPQLHINKEDSKQFYTNLPASFLSSGITQVNTLIDRVMASNLNEGSVSILNYGGRVFSVLLDLCGQIFSTASYPHMIELVVNKEWKELSNLLRNIIEVIWLITIPVAAFGVLYSRSVIAIIFGHGAFDYEKVIVTAYVLSAYIIALPLSSLTNVFNNVYFGDGNTRTPMLLNLLTLLLNIVLNFIFVHFFGIAGLAFATSVAIIIVFIIRYALLSKKIENYFIRINRNIIEIVVATAVSCTITFLTTSLLGVENDYVICIIAFALGISIYFGFLAIFKMPLLKQVFDMIKGTVKR